MEFLRIAKNKIERDGILNFLKSEFFILPADPDLYMICKELYPLYNYCRFINNPKQVSVVDALNACYLKRYKNNLFFITFDNNDYPLEFLDRINVGAIDLVKEKEIVTWGIYRFNELNYMKLLNRYNNK